MTDKSKGEPDKANSPALSADWGSLTARPAAPPDADADAERASAPKGLRPGEADVRSAPPSTEPGTRTDPATATAADTAEAGRLQFDAVGARAGKPLAPVDASPRPGRPGSPVLAGAAIAGLLLIAAPFAVSAGVQGVSLDVIPLSGGGVDGDDGQTGDDRQTGSEQDTSSGGSETVGQGGSTDQGQADSGGAASDGGGGGGGVNNAPDPGPGYVPEAMEQQAGIPSSSPEDDGGSGGGEQDTGGAGANVAAGGGGDSSKGSSRTADKDDSGNGGDSQAAGGSESAGGSANGGIINDLPDVNTASSDEEEEQQQEQERGGDEEGSNQRSAPSDGSGEQEAGTFSALSDSSPSAEERQPSPSGEPSNAAPSPSGDPSPSADPSPSGDPSPSASPSGDPSPSASPSGDRYSALAGPGCATDGGAYGQAGSWYPENSTAGWATREGGHDQDGCGGDYDAIPVSGDPEYGDGQFAYWTFSPGYADAECELYVHVPDDESPLWVGEQEARYQIFPRDKAEGDAVAVFGINQSQVKGGWVQVTGFTSPAEQFTVQLTNIGENPLAGQENTSTHVAASAVRATCS